MLYLAIIDFSIVSIGLPWPECLIVEIIQYCVSIFHCVNSDALKYLTISRFFLAQHYFLRLESFILHGRNIISFRKLTILVGRK